MNKVFDYNGTFVSPSKPVKQLRTVKKTILIDSADRDTTKYYTNGDFVVYLPRSYKNVVSMRLKSAEFPPLTVGAAGAGAFTHLYTNGPNLSAANGGTWSAATDVPVPATNYYFLLELEGLNKYDETVSAANRSTYVDNVFAKIPVNLVVQSTTATPGYFIEYNDHTLEENISRYTPAIENLDRIHIKCRLHSQQDKSGYIYWTSDGTYAGNGGNSIANFALTLEVETLENTFDDFSSFETRINNRDAGNYGC
jgi:hypothetical protein